MVSRPSTGANRPSTARSTATMRASNSVIVAITEGRGVASEIGLAWIDLITVECGLTQVVKEIKL